MQQSPYCIGKVIDNANTNHAMLYVENMETKLSMFHCTVLHCTVYTCTVQYSIYSTVYHGCCLNGFFDQSRIIG